MNEQSQINKRAWEYRTYEAWVERDGLPSEKAKKIGKNPLGCLKIHQNYFQNVKGTKIANICGSNGRKAVPLARLGASVTVFDISEGNKKYAMELADASGVYIDYVVTDIYDIELDRYGEYFDMLYMEGGILHYFHDIDRLMKVLYGILNRKGKVILSDFHPFRKLISRNPMQASYGDYFDSSIVEADVAYKAYLHEKANAHAPKCRLRLYTISEIVNAMIRNGFTIKEFNEHPSYVDSKIPGEFTIYAMKE